MTALMQPVACAPTQSVPTQNPAAASSCFFPSATETPPRADATATPPSISGLGAKQMSDTGLSIAAPDKSPAVDQAAARKALPALPDNAQVLQVVLANVTDSHDVPALHCLCYVVSITPQSPPSDGPSNRPQPPGTFTMELVDAATGRYLGELGN